MTRVKSEPCAKLTPADTALRRRFGGPEIALWYNPALKPGVAGGSVNAFRSRRRHLQPRLVER
jgi:hypothetical protein